MSTEIVPLRSSPAIAQAPTSNLPVLAIQLGRKIYVLHAFQKKSKRGIETTQHDVNLIKQRYAEAKERAKHEE
jgi:phage-related protein